MTSSPMAGTARGAPCASASSATEGGGSGTPLDLRTAPTPRARTTAWKRRSDELGHNSPHGLVAGGERFGAPRSGVEHPRVPGAVTRQAALPRGARRVSPSWQPLLSPASRRMRRCKRRTASWCGRRSSRLARRILARGARRRTRCSVRSRGQGSDASSPIVVTPGLQCTPSTSAIGVPCGSTSGLCMVSRVLEGSWRGGALGSNWLSRSRAECGVSVRQPVTPSPVNRVSKGRSRALLGDESRHRVVVGATRHRVVIGATRHRTDDALTITREEARVTERAAHPSRCRSQYRGANSDLSSDPHTRPSSASVRLGVA